jgi:hypothetical protein
MAVAVGHGIRRGINLRRVFLYLGLAPESRIVERLPLALDLTGTFVFALSSASADVKQKLDLFGVLVLSFAAATAGGIARDVLIGASLPRPSVNDGFSGVLGLRGG